jgi:hypothetical protein
MKVSPVFAGRSLNSRAEAPPDFFVFFFFSTSAATSANTLSSVEVSRGWVGEVVGA